SSILAMACLKFSQLAVQIVVLYRGLSSRADYDDPAVLGDFNSRDIHTSFGGTLGGFRYVLLFKKRWSASHCFENPCLRVAFSIGLLFSSACCDAYALSAASSYNWSVAPKARPALNRDLVLTAVR